MNGTVHYAMIVLRGTSGCKIIADYSTNLSSIYRTIALSTIDGLKTVEDDKISVDNSRYTVHVLIGELYYVCLTSKVNCPSSAIWVESCSQIFLQRLRTVYRDLPLADLSKNLTNFAEDNLSKPLKKIIEEYNQGIGCKNLTSKLEEELIEVRCILMNGVQKLIDRGERLDELIRKTQNLEISNRATDFIKFTTIAYPLQYEYFYLQSRDFHVVSRTRQQKNSSLKIVIVTSAFMLVLVVFLTLRFAIDPIELRNAIQIKHDLAESSKLMHFIAARKIQAWFRGIITRNHLRKLHEKATILQRHWRGYYTRMFIINQYLVERVHQMRQDHYNNMATKIQAVWRGYWSRKTKINFLQLQRWLKNVYIKNNETLENMKRFRQRELEHAESLTEQEAMLWILFILFKLHHLLRTKCRPGVITRIDKTRFIYIEEMLKCLEYNQYIVKSKTICKDCQIDRKPSLIFRGTYFEKFEKEIREFEKSLSSGNMYIFKSIVDQY
ncbi:Spermatogenesis-associated protein 17 [Cyphomyrmex costatus]|uniref:Spermatogenesis-associated protein 17 n=1 Tax=Cyphomyrmex costatus TaxID=456900 RepID=A0A151IER2_9HYME|nr:Spermatogenesis-associated protein 17 [Cyphomyrmex costatus]